MMKQRKFVGFLRGTLFLSAIVASLMLGSAPVFAAPAAPAGQTQSVVNGVVRDASGEPIVGANVVVKGTSNGTITDANGRFSIEASKGATLVVSYVGYNATEVAAASNLSVTLTEDTEVLEDVVITALGIKKERKALGYSMSDVNADELMKNKSTNVINSLAGKVPGVNITQSSGAAGAGAAIIIRGGNSASEGRDNQPLFVVDGIIYDNSTSVVGNSGTDGATRSNTTFSNRVMDINPEDIETLTVLKGAAAAALYGSRAADGAIVITTKKGAEGSVKVNYNGKVSTSWATRLPQAQTQFGHGAYSQAGALTSDTYSSWGPALANNAEVYDNINTFFQNGVIADNNVSVSGGNKIASFFLSLSNYDQTGIIRETGYDKTTVRFNGDIHYGRLTVGANMSYSISQTDKTLTSGGLYGGGGSGSMNSLFTFPNDIDMSKYLNEDGTKYRPFGSVFELAEDKENPYWIINQNKLQDKTHRFTGALNASFKIFDWWDISARVGYDNYTTDAYTYIAPGGCVSLKYQNGRLSKNDYRYEYLSTNVMTNFHKTFGDFDLGLMVGTTTESTNRNNQTHWGYNFITAGTVSFSNIADNTQWFKDANSKKRLVGVYGEFRASWRNQLYLTVTGRNDWSSTLPVENRSYFYPSVSGSWVFSELIKKNTAFTFGKVRASWARVGKDANAYATLTYLAPNYNYNGIPMVGNDYVLGNSALKPEIQDSWEVGAELKFLNDRLGLDWTYYSSTTSNQIASPRLSNAGGGIMTSINSGSVKNHGMEIALTAKPVKTKKFVWDMMLNFSYNRGTLGDFLDGVSMFYTTDAQFGTVKGASVPNGGDFLALVGTRYAYETEADAEGNIVENMNGAYEIDPKTGLYKIYTANSNEQVGNREPRFLGGFNNTFSFYNFTINVLFDFRFGGDVYNGTEYVMVANGTSPLTCLNDRKEVTVNGKVNTGTADAPVWEDFSQTYKAGEMYTIADKEYSGEAMIQNYWDNYCSNSYNFITSVNWLKLRNLSLSYDFTPLIKKQKVIKNLSVSLAGSNLFTWTNYKGMDPEVSTAGGAGGAGSVGIDYCSVPSTASFTAGLNITF